MHAASPLRTADRRRWVCFDVVSLSTAPYGVSDTGVRDLLMGSSNDAGAGSRRLVTFGVWLLLVALFVGLWEYVGGGGRQSYGPPLPSSALPPPRRQAVEAKASDGQIAEALAPFRARLDASRRAVARVRLLPMPFDDVRVSKVGGEPYLPAGESPPRTADGGAMVLLAQINFAELPAMPGYPSAGLLQFFIARGGSRFLYGMDLDGRSPDALMVQHSFRVRYVEQVDAGARPGRARPRCGGRCETPHDPDRPRRMFFTVEEEPISASDVNFAAVVGFEPSAWVMERAAAWQVDQFDLARRALPTADGHKLGGYPFFTQDDPRPDGTPLRLLLQLDTDDEMMWGDAGVGAFFIDPADLARRDFARVLYSWDCS